MVSLRSLLSLRAHSIAGHSARIGPPRPNGTLMNAPSQASQLSHNVTRISHLDLPGAGQVYVDGGYAYIGHIPNNQQLGTSILDVSDPKHPQVVCQITLDDPESHSHKARVIGNIMIVNSERNMTGIGRKADELPKLRVQLREALGRDADARGARAEAGRAPRRHSGGRSAGEESVPQRRLQDLRHLRSRQIPSSSISSAPTASACIASTWTRTTPTSPRRRKDTSATSCASTTSAIPPGRKKSRSGGSPASTRRAARRRPGPAGSIDCITRCVSETVFTPAAGTAACASST